MFYLPHIDFLELPCDRLDPAFDGLVILHLSDMHLSRWSWRLELWQEALAGLHPHILLITGDLGHRSWHWRRSLANIQRLLEPLTPPLGTFFILGNHDSTKLGPALAQTHDRAGHPRVLLQNQTVFVTPQASGLVVTGNSEIDQPPREALPAAAPDARPRLAIIGIHQHRRIDTDIPSAMATVRPGDFKLMMLHYPDLVHPAIAAGADLCLAGHTHGGQICWPDGRPLFRQDTLPRQMCTGVHRINGTWMIVNRGIGAAGVRMRIFCPPQAMQIVLRAKTRPKTGMRP